MSNRLTMICDQIGLNYFEALLQVIFVIFQQFYFTKLFYLINYYLLTATMKRTESDLLASNQHLMRQDIYQENDQAKDVQSRIDQRIILEVRQKNNNDSNFILFCLRNHFIFYNLSDAQLQNIKNKMFFVQVQAGVEIYDQDTVGSCFFILKSGIMEMLVDQKLKKQIKPQDGFGQVALLYNSKRNQTVRSRQKCTLWVIDRQSFREAVEQVILKEYTDNRKNLQGIRFFSNLSNDHKDLIASALITQKFYKNQTIVQQGDPGSSLYYIKNGNASVYKGTKYLRKLGKGDSFGQQSLYYNTMRQLTIKADDQVTCLVLGRDTLNRILGDKVYEVTFKNFIRWAFQKNTILNRLNKEQTQKIIESMKVSSFKTNQQIFRKGISGFQKLVVVIQGGLKKMRSNTIVAGKGQCYGEEYLLNQNKEKVLEDEVVMQTDGVIAQIADTAFYQVIGSSSYNKIVSIQDNKKNQIFTQFQNVVKLQLQKAKFSEFIVNNKLNNGQFGKLYTVKDKKGADYVAKFLSKDLLEEAQVSHFIFQESHVFNFVSHPFIVRCGKKYHSQHYLLYLMQYVKGEEFYQVLKKLGLLSTFDAQFYSASIILILQYFENIGVICRDIKPENFIVDANGYLKLINLSTAKVSKMDTTNKLMKTFTIIGTPHYMAPDIVIGKGYTNLVDLWSLGVCLYEFLCGNLPFGDSSEGAYQIYEEIMQKDLKFPQFMQDKKARKLIEQLLSHNPEQRHGGSFKDLKEHQWFQKFDWQSLLNKDRVKLDPPYTSNQKFYQGKKDNYEGRKLADLIQEMQKNIRRTDDKKKNAQYEFNWQQFGEYVK